MAVGLGAAAVAPNVWAAAVFVIGMGIGNGVAVVANSLLVQRGTPDHLRGRAFTLAMSVTYSALFIGMLIGGVLSDALGARMAWGVASVIAGIAAVASYVLARGIPGAVPEQLEPIEPLPIVVGAGGDPAELGALHE
jgi:MFS family permease